jgi:hypothetical protein
MALFLDRARLESALPQRSAAPVAVVDVRHESPAQRLQRRADHLTLPGVISTWT